MATRRSPPEGGLEKHAQTIIASLILAAVLFTGKTMLEIQTQQVTTTSEVSGLKEKVGELQVRIATLQGDLSRSNEDRLKGSEALSQFQRRDNTLEDHEKRIRVLETFHPERSKVNK